MPAKLVVGAPADVTARIARSHHEQSRIPKPENTKILPARKRGAGRAATREDAYACEVVVLRLAREVHEPAEVTRGEEGSCQPR